MDKFWWWSQLHGREHHGALPGAALVLVILCHLLPGRPSPRDERSSGSRNTFCLHRCCDGVRSSITLRIVLLPTPISAPASKAWTSGAASASGHEGLGANLFSLAAMALTCLLWGAGAGS